MLIDLDPKGNVATTFGIDKRTLGPTMNELFKGGIDGTQVSLNQCLLGPGNLTQSMKKSWRNIILGKREDRLKKFQSIIYGFYRRPRSFGS